MDEEGVDAKCTRELMPMLFDSFKQVIGPTCLSWMIEGPFGLINRFEAFQHCMIYNQK
jgi:hypothetical protein